jgi:hypothetical protein
VTPARGQPASRRRKQEAGKVGPSSGVAWIMITVPTIGEPKIAASAAKLPAAETASPAWSGPAAEPIGPRSTRGPCRLPKGDRVQVLADIGDHQVHVRAGELQMTGRERMERARAARPWMGAAEAL